MIKKQWVITYQKYQDINLCCQQHGLSLLANALADDVCISNERINTLWSLKTQVSKIQHQGRKASILYEPCDTPVNWCTPREATTFPANIYTRNQIRNSRNIRSTNINHLEQRNKKLMRGQPSEGGDEFLLRHMFHVLTFFTVIWHLHGKDIITPIISYFDNNLKSDF